MPRLKSFLFGRGGLAAGVVLVHLLLAYLFIHSRVRIDLSDPGPVFATFMDDGKQARPGVQPVQVQAQQVIPNRGLVSSVPDVGADEQPRIDLYRFEYSRIGERPADRVPGEQATAGASEVATPGGEAALRRFIDVLKSGNVPGAQSGSARSDVAKIRSALDEWGAVRSIQFSGGVGDHGWSTYDIKPEFRDSPGPATVEVRWDLYEVRHEHGTSVWRVAVDREGTVWCAQAGAAPSSR